MRWLAACTGMAALAAGLALGLPALILVFLIALASDVSWSGAFARGLVALAVLGGIGWVGGAVVQLAQEPVDTAGTAAIGAQVDLTVGEAAGAGAAGDSEGATGVPTMAVGDRPGRARSPVAGSR